MSNPDFERRVRMIEAGTAGDLHRVNELLKEDVSLAAFNVYLRSMSQDDMALVEKSLKLPALDRGSPEFERMITDLVYTAAYRNQKEFAEVLLGCARNPAELAQDGLAHMFNTMSGSERIREPSPEVAALLVRQGADVARASASGEMALDSQLRSIAEKKAKFEAFRRAIA